MSFSQNSQSAQQVSCLIQDVSQNISPRIAIPSGASHSRLWVPHLFPYWNFGRKSSQNSNKSHPANVRMRLKSFSHWLINCYQGVFADGIARIPVEGSHMKGFLINCCSGPDTSHSASCLYEFREDVKTRNIMCLNFGTCGNTSYLFIIARFSVFFCN